MNLEAGVDDERHVLSQKAENESAFSWNLFDSYCYPDNVRSEKCEH